MKKLVFVILFLNLIFQSAYSQVVNSVLALEKSIGALSIFPYTDTVLTADKDYNGIKASGTVSLFKSPVTNDVRNPIIFLDGLDIDNTRDAYGIFELLCGKIDPVFTNQGWPNGPNMAQILLNNGYDIIIVDYTDARTYIQANAYLVVKVIQEVNRIKAGKNSNVLVGPSMGGIVGRYALSYMEAYVETTGDHQTRLFISYDSPQRGGNIPLGDQYFIKFIADNADKKSAKPAQDKLDLLDDIAPRQLCVYHHSEKEYPYEHPDRTRLVTELNNLGYPKTCRNVAITNGSANGKGLNFGPGATIVSYEHEYLSLLSLSGVPVVMSFDFNAFAVPEITNGKIADCTITIDGVVFADSKPKVENTLPYDNAPGGMRATNKEIADEEPDAGGDIKTEFPNHCFIPTISALDIDTKDLFYNIQADPDILSKTPFDAIYYPIEDASYYPNKASKNQPHVYITSEVVNWMLNELVPDNIVLDGTTKNFGDVVAKKSITFLPGFQADETSELHAKLGTYKEFDFSTVTTPPVVTTAVVTDITSNSEIIGGVVTSDGDRYVYARGVCWSTAQNPTIALTTKTSDGKGTGSFTSTIKFSKELTPTPFNTYYVRAYATNINGTSYGKEITLYGFVFDEVTTKTGRTWMDRNLGADRVATSFNEHSGDYFQWGRAADGHEKYNSETTNIYSNNDTPENDKFYCSDVDWRKPQNDDLWQGVKKGNNNPCPNGYRLPTKAEFEEEIKYWSGQYRGFQALNLTKTFYRFGGGNDCGVLDGSSSWGYYWTSSTVSSIQYGKTSYYFCFGNNSYERLLSDAPRSAGFNVRCIKD